VLAAITGMVAVTFVFLPNVPKLVSFSSPTEFAASDVAPVGARSLVVPARFVESSASLRETKAGSAVDARRSAHRARTMTSGKSSIYQKGRQSSAEKKNGGVILAKAKTPATQEMVVYTATTNFYQHGDGVVGVTEWRVMVVKVRVAKTDLVQRPSRT
jgi:hypothetical protein